MGNPHTKQVGRAERDGDSPDEHVVFADAGDGVGFDDGERLILQEWDEYMD